MFAYCNNNPTNMVDCCGRWPTWATIPDEAEKRLEHIWEFFSGIIESVFNSIEAEIGMGVGYGGSASVDIGGANATISAEKSLSDSIVCDDGEFDCRFTETSSMGLVFFDQLGFKPSVESSHSFRDANCTCDAWIDTFGEKKDCPSNTTKYGVDVVDMKIGLSFSLYLAVGVKASFCVNLEELLAGFGEVYANALEY